MGASEGKLKVPISSDHSQSQSSVHSSESSLSQSLVEGPVTINSSASDTCISSDISSSLPSSSPVSYLASQLLSLPPPPLFEPVKVSVDYSSPDNCSSFSHVYSAIPYIEFYENIRNQINQKAILAHEQYYSTQSTEKTNENHSQSNHSASDAPVTPVKLVNSKVSIISSPLSASSPHPPSSPLTPSFVISSCQSHLIASLHSVENLFTSEITTLERSEESLRQFLTESDELEQVIKSVEESANRLRSCQSSLQQLVALLTLEERKALLSS
jgi:hypothetical protein